MAYGVDRPRVSAIGEYGYEPPSNQADIVTPTFSSWLDKSLTSKYNYAYNPAKAKSILEKAGYKKGPTGSSRRTASSSSFTIINVGGNSDWVASVNVIASELAQVGIKLTPDNLTGTDFDPSSSTAITSWPITSRSGGPSPYYELRQLLYSGNTRAHRQAGVDQLGALRQPQALTSSSTSTRPPRAVLPSTASSTSSSR